MLNVVFGGFLNRDAELKQTPNGKTVCNFDVPARDRKDDPTMWLSCALWNRAAEALHPYLVKGSHVSGTGRLKLREYESKKHGGTRFAYEVEVISIDVTRGRDGGRADGGGAGGSGGSSAPVSIDEAQRILDEPVEDLPF